MERRKFLKGTIAGALTATSAPVEQKTLEERALSNDAMELFEICKQRLRKRHSARENNPAQINMPMFSSRLLAEIQSIGLPAIDPAVFQARPDSSHAPA